jgi:hypothetical protein
LLYFPKENSKMSSPENVKMREVKQPAGTPKVNWDSSKMRSAYANVCNATCTREEVVLFFGLNQAWSGTEDEVTVQLEERVILSPFAAKRLNVLLTTVLQQYEERFGALDVVTAPGTKK